jgi:hypothetical protein
MSWEEFATVGAAFALIGLYDYGRSLYLMKRINKLETQGDVEAIKQYINASSYNIFEPLSSKLLQRLGKEYNLPRFS